MGGCRGVFHDTNYFKVELVAQSQTVCYTKFKVFRRRLRQVYLVRLAKVNGGESGYHFEIEYPEEHRIRKDHPLDFILLGADLHKTFILEMQLSGQRNIREILTERIGKRIGRRCIILHSRSIPDIADNTVNAFIAAVEFIKPDLVGYEEKNNDAGGQPDRKPKDIDEGVILISQEITHRNDEIIPDHDSLHFQRSYHNYNRLIINR